MQKMLTQSRTSPKKCINYLHLRKIKHSNDVKEMKKLMTDHVKLLQLKDNVTLKLEPSMLSSWKATCQMFAAN